MKKNDRKKLQVILKMQEKLKKMSAQKVKLSLQLASTQKLIEELMQTDQNTVYHVIDGILIPRNTQVVRKEMLEKAEFLSSKLSALKEEWDEEFATFKRMNLTTADTMPNVNDYTL